MTGAGSKLLVLLLCRKRLELGLETLPALVLGPGYTYYYSISTVLGLKRGWEWGRGSGVGLSLVVHDSMSDISLVCTNMAYVYTYHNIFIYIQMLA
jgi:hypothetical protein